MNTPKPTVLQRVKTLIEWIEPKREAYYAIPKKERPLAFRHAYMLLLTLEAAMYRLPSFFEQVLVEPMRAVNDESLMKRINMVDFLLPRLERWMNGQWTDQEMVEYTHTYCKERVMQGSLADMNCTSPMVNMFSVYTYQNYCEIIRVINNSVISAQAEKDAPDEVPAPKKRASRAKARP